MPNLTAFTYSPPSNSGLNLFYKDQTTHYEITAVKISRYDTSGRDLQVALEGINTIGVTGAVDLFGKQIELKVISRKEFSSYHVYTVEPLKVPIGIVLSGIETVILNPYYDSKEQYYDYTVTLNQVNESRTSDKFKVSDHRKQQSTPSNLDAILGIRTRFLTDIIWNTGTYLETYIPSNKFTSLIGYSEYAQLAVLTSDITLDLNLSMIGTIINNVNGTIHNFKGLDITGTSKMYLQIDTSPSFSSVSLVELLFLEETFKGHSNNISFDYTKSPINRILQKGSTYYFRIKQQVIISSVEDITKFEVVTGTFNSYKSKNKTAIKVKLLDKVYKSYAEDSETQDYNYSSVGLINGRYNGSTTSAETYGGISPALTGKVVKTSVYTTTVTDKYIVSQSFSDKIITNLLFTGKGEYPSISLQSIGRLSNTLTASGSIIRNTDLQSSIDFTTLGLTQGDLLKIQQEYLIIKSVQPTYLEVSRAAARLKPVTTFDAATSHPVFTPVYYVDGDKVFKLNKNKVEKVVESKLWITDTEDILRTDRLGNLVDSTNINLVDIYDCITANPTGFAVDQNGVITLPTITSGSIVSYSPTSFSTEYSPVLRTVSLSIKAGNYSNFKNAGEEIICSVTATQPAIPAPSTTPSITPSPSPAAPGVTPSPSNSPAPSPSSSPVTQPTAVFDNGKSVSVSTFTGPSATNNLTGTLTITGGSKSFKIQVGQYFNQVNTVVGDVVINGNSISANLTGGSATTSANSLTLGPGTYSYTMTVTVTLNGTTQGSGRADIIEI